MGLLKRIHWQCTPPNHNRILYVELRNEILSALYELSGQKLLFSQLRYGSFLNKILFKQESIPVGCVPPTFLVPVGEGVCPPPRCRPPSPPDADHPPPGCKPPPLVVWTVMHAGSQLPCPPVDRQTPVKTLPCPKLRLRATKIWYVSFIYLKIDGRSWNFLIRMYGHKLEQPMTFLHTQISR